MSEWLQWQSRLEEALHEHLQSNSDSSHDLAHLQRVWRNCRLIIEGDSASVDEVALVAAAYLHDLVNLPKNDPDRSLASRRSAEGANTMLQSMAFPQDKLATVSHAIEAHSFSAGIEARSAEARILQDADRLDGLGALGIARVFYIAGMLQSQLFDPVDPLAEHRTPDDKVSALDHFYTKLLRLPDTMHTETGKKMAMDRAEVMRVYLRQLKDEIVGDSSLLSQFN